MEPTYAEMDNLYLFENAHIAVARAESFSSRGNYRQLEKELPSLVELACNLAELSNANISSPLSSCDVEIVEEPAVLLIRLTRALSGFLSSAGRLKTLTQLNKWSQAASFGLELGVQRG